MDHLALIDRYLSGEADSDEVKQLDAALAVDVELRREFVLRTEISTHLRQIAGDESVSVDAFEPELATVSRDGPWIKSWLGSGAVVAAVLLVALMWMLPRGGVIQTVSATQAENMLQLVNVVIHRDDDLWAAARDGDTTLAQRLIDAGTPVDSRLDERNLTPLHVAALFSQPEVATLLLAHGADVSAIDVEGNSTLHMAAFLAHDRFVELLLQEGASADARNGLGYTPLNLASIPWTPELETIYIHLAKVMHLAPDLERIRAARPRVAKLLRDHSAYNKNRATANTPPSMNVWHAAATGDVAVVRKHIALGTYLDGKEPLGGSTPLILAAIFGQPETVKLLIEAGADREARNHSGITALYAASFFCQSDVVQVLLEHGADTRQTNPDGLTPLDAVSLEWNDEREKTYRIIYQSLGIEYDEDRIKQARSEIATLLNQHQRENP